MSILDDLLKAMRSFSEDVTSVQFDLEMLDEANRELVDQVLGEGEVSVVFSHVAMHISPDLTIEIGSGVFGVRADYDGTPGTYIITMPMTPAFEA